MNEIVNVFVIGPMGQDKDDPVEQRTPISRHMSNIEAALAEAFKLIPAYSAEVNTPHHGGADIVDTAFNWIDRADLAVADITSRSPSVMYELAFFHALGTPVIVLDDEREKHIPFYLKDANILRVRDFEIPALTVALFERLKIFFDRSADQNFSANPISKFYSAPLIEISGSATIARGYFGSFIRPILDSSSGVVHQIGARNVRRVIVIRPEPGFDVSEDGDHLKAILTEANSGEPIAETVWTIPAKGRERKVSSYYLGGLIVDYPRTITTITGSPRMQRLINRSAISAGSSFVDPLIAETDMLKIQESLITFFFNSIVKDIQTNQENLFWRKYQVMTLNQLAEVFG